MKINVRFFAQYKELTGADSIVMELPDGKSGSYLLEQLIKSYPGLKIMNNNVRLAVNLEFKSIDTILTDGDEVAFIAPVSGG